VRWNTAVVGLVMLLPTGVVQGRGSMWALRICFGVVAALMLIACGGEGEIPRVQGPSTLPLQEPGHASQAPTVEFLGGLHVGADVGPPAGTLEAAGVHGEARVFHGTVRDGVSAAELTAYLQADAASFGTPAGRDMEIQFFPDGFVFRFGMRPPTLRVVEGTPAQLVDETVRVVQAINAALPRDWQLGFDPGPAPRDSTEPLEGEILVTFAAQDEWPVDSAPPGDENIGLAVPRYTIVPTGDPTTPFRIEIVAGRVWVDPTQTEGLERLGVLAHEIVHLLGRNHVDPTRFPMTLMVAGGSEELSEHILHPLDREALLAVYSRLKPGVAPDRLSEELGPWSDTSLHVRGAIGLSSNEVIFGAALRNGLSQPWAAGPAPQSNLHDNRSLSGSITWSGRLLGLTPSAETVAGAAEATVELATLSGTVDFTALEYWAAEQPPGALGTGTMWHNGDLRYSIQVRGNTFVDTGGDDGTVTGAFFGPGHKGMGGVLVREDLSAGFGGKR